MGGVAGVAYLASEEVRDMVESAIADYFVSSSKPEPWLLELATMKYPEYIPTLVMDLDIVTKWNVPVTGVLHRDFCKKQRNHYIKDISKLGRKMDKTLILDHDTEAFKLQAENGIAIR